MNEFVLVEFLFATNEYTTELNKLIALGNDFKLLRCDDTYEDEFQTEYKKVLGKINAMTAAVIRLQNPIMANKMRISYISDELKNVYRK